MLTMSSATTSARDWVPFNETNLQTHMCILILMKRDGTLFDVTSVLQEDIIKICVSQGHTHAMGVLCYSATELVILFQSANNMQCATCGAIKATVLCKEAIAIRASTPSKTHVRTYMSTVGGKPSRTQPPPLEGEEEPHLPTGNPHLGGETLHHLQVDFHDLADHELHQLMEDLCWEVALCELNAPPRNPSPTPWGNSAGSRDPDVDDQEVTFLRGVGAVPLGQPFQPPASAWPDGGWASQGPLP